MLRVVLVDVLLVGLVDVLAKHHVAVFAHCLQACLLRDGGYVGRADLFGPVDVVLKIHFLVIPKTITVREFRWLSTPFFYFLRKERGKTTTENRTRRNKQASLDKYHRQQHEKIPSCDWPCRKRVTESNKRARSNKQ